MRVGQPGMQRREADLRSVAEKQEYEGDIEQGRVEFRRMLDQERPDHAVLAFAHDRTRRHVDQDRSEQGECNADAAQDEILPRRFESGVCAIDADHQHGGQRGDFDRDPHQPDIVRHESEVHAEHHGLIHGVVETQVDRRQTAAIQFVRDVARAEDAGCEAYEGVENDEDDIQIVDQHIRSGRRAFDHEQRESGKKCRQAGDDVQTRRQPVARQYGQQRCRADWNQQDGRHGIDRRHAHRCSPR